MTFSELIRGDKPVLVDFSAEWCGPCKMLAPILTDVKNKIGDQASIFKLDVDRNPAIASSYNVMSVPDPDYFPGREAGLAALRSCFCCRTYKHP